MEIDAEIAGNNEKNMQKHMKNKYFVMKMQRNQYCHVVISCIENKRNRFFIFGIQTSGSLFLLLFLWFSLIIEWKNNQTSTIEGEMEWKIDMLLK